MGEFISLTAEDGHELAAYEAIPTGEVKGRIVVIQEIFGVNQHIRNVCDRFAAKGYRAVAPALYDRLERDVDLGYDEEGFARGLPLRQALDPARLDDVLRDVKAAADHLGGAGEAGIVGYCFGGLVVWLAACRLDFACASSYYGRTIEQYADEVPRCPTICHFGAKDQSIPLAVSEAVRAQRPEVDVHVYDADHGFVCDERASFDEAAAAAATARTMKLFADNLR